MLRLEGGLGAVKLYLLQFDDAGLLLVGGAHFGFVYFGAVFQMVDALSRVKLGLCFKLVLHFGLFIEAGFEGFVFQHFQALQLQRHFAADLRAVGLMAGVGVGIGLFEHLRHHAVTWPSSICGAWASAKPAKASANAPAKWCVRSSQLPFSWRT